MSIENSDRLPLKAAGTLATVACSVRIILGVLYQDMSTGEFIGPKYLQYISSALYVVALAALAVFAFVTYKGGFSKAEHIDGNFAVFIFSMAGFFFLFSSAVVAYTVFKNVEFHKGATLVSDIILLVFSLGTAAFFFIEASSKSAKISHHPAYPLLCLFPVGWTAVRLFVMFTTFTARATYATEKLQILSITVLCFYFLYEARLIRAAKPEKLTLYSVITVLTLATVPLSAFPTLLFSLIYDTGAKIGEPLFCLAELALCAVAVLRASDILKNSAKKGASNEND